MDVPNLEEMDIKKIICIAYEWEPSRCNIYVLFGQSPGLKATPKQVENQMDKGKGLISGADDEGFIEVKRRILGGSKFTTHGTQEEGKCSFPLVERINVIKKQILDGKLVLVDDDEKPLEKVDYPANSYNDDEVEPVENDTASFLASKGVGYGLKNL
ncbi:hypothetical protein Tco_0026221 [Tanacetum coccineum]